MREQVRITTVRIADIRERTYARNDPTGEIRQQLAELHQAWEAATMAQEWEKAAAFSHRSEALLKILWARASVVVDDEQV